MVEKSQFQSSEQKKNARIEYLENLAKWHLFSLELLASLGELHHSASQNRDPEKIFRIANEHLLKIIKFDAMAFFLVDEPDAEFLIKYVQPLEYEKVIQEEVNCRINDGSFAWAVNQNRPVAVKSVDGKQSLILHVLSTKRRVRGMFAGLISDIPNRLEETIQYTLSIILQNTANALESMALYNLFQEINLHLESKIRERTTDLEDHMVKMKEEIAYRKLAEESLWVARQEMESALKAKTNLLSQFSHELKTPINSILGYGEIIRSEIEKSGQTHLSESLEIIQTTGRHLLNLIDDIQNLAQSNKQPLDLQPQTFSVSDVLAGVSATLFPMARKNGNELEIKSSPDIGLMVSDESRVRQILLNIIGNACKFTEKGKIVVECIIESVASEEWVCFRISDNGVGMAPEQIRELFQDREVGTAQAGPFDGAGMGLSFSKRLCAMLGGSIQVKSELGKGSTFTVRLPRDIQSVIARQRRKPKPAELKTPSPVSGISSDSHAEKEPSAKSAQSKDVASDESLKVKKIGVVDDDPANSKILCHILKEEGWLAQPVELSSAALGSMGKNVPDLMVVCLGISEGDGCIFFSELGKQESMKSIPMLIFTARELADNEKSLLQGRVQAILYKGNCTRSELTGQIKNLLRNETVG